VQNDVDNMNFYAGNSNPFLKENRWKIDTAIFGAWCHHNALMSVFYLILPRFAVSNLSDNSANN